MSDEVVTASVSAEAETSSLLLSGKVAVITGGTSAIGRACATRLVANGAKVVVADVNASVGAEVVRAISETGGQLRYLQANSAERLDIHNLIATTLEAYGFVDILICAASEEEETPFLELREEHFDRSVRSRLKGTFLSSQAVAKQFILQQQQGRTAGTIITAGSAGLIADDVPAIASAASRGGVMELTKTIASAVASHGIRVNAIGPLTVADDEPSVENGKEDANQDTTADRQAHWDSYVEDVAKLVTWLVSEHASHVSGEVVFVGDRRAQVSNLA